MLNDRFNDFPIGAVSLLTADMLQYERLAVDQPPGGGNAYPFVPRHALTPLIGDFYLSYRDDLRQVAMPLRIVWLHGFGINPSTRPGGLPAPVHDREVLVADALGQVVFDSTTATTYSDFGWGARRVVAWETTESVARLVFYMGQLGFYPTEIAYSDAVLDPRTWIALPQRVRRIRVGGFAVDGPVALAAGYNLELASEAGSGLRPRNTITISGVIGAGQGRKPGCAETEVVATVINGVNPDAGGNFRIQVDDCYRAERPLQFTGSGAGRSGAFAASGDAAAIRLFGDCKPCCTCDDYANTYRGLDTVWDNWAAVTRQAEQVRDIYTRNRARWEAAGDCRRAAALKLLALREPDCKTFLGAIYCNASACCLGGLRVRFTIQRHTAGVLDGSTLDDVTVVAAYVSGPGTHGEQAYAPRQIHVAGALVVECFFDNADPAAAVTAKLRVCATCAAGQSLTATATAHAAATAASCALETVAVPADLASLWTAGGLDTVPLLAVSEAAAPLDPTPPAPLCGC